MFRLPFEIYGVVLASEKIGKTFEKNSAFFCKNNNNKSNHNNHNNVIHANCRGAIGRPFPVEESLFVLSPHIPDCVILLSEALFFAQGRFFASETWYHYCSRNWSGCGRPETRSQVRARPFTLSLSWRGIEYKI